MLSWSNLESKNIFLFLKKSMETSINNVFCVFLFKFSFSTYTEVCDSLDASGMRGAFDQG